MNLGNTSVLLGAENVEVSELRRLAKVVETAGFHAAWTVDGDADPSVFSHEILAQTTGLVSGSCVVARWKRHPMLMAQTLASLDHLYPGRVSIGIGSAAWMSHPRASWGAPLDHLVGRMSEFVEILRRALAGEHVDVDGRYYVAEGRAAPTPSHHVPIYVAAAGPQMAGLAGRKADGVFLHVGTAARIGVLAEAARSAAERVGRDPDGLRVDQVVYACVDETRELAADALRRLIATGLSDDQLTEAVTELRSAETAAAVITQRTAGDHEAVAAAIPDEFLDQVGVALARSESAAYVDEALARVRAPGVSALTLYPLPAKASDFAGSYAAFADLFQRLAEAN
ncbi:LLM class flavin-dependent oxidoreductase [Kribbella speibonae]|nr:LLM class flavin-dependent oxidoreductase [Kribbella speibonae]